MLLREIWGERAAGDMDLVRNFVKKLRAKLGEDAAQPTWIFNELIVLPPPWHPPPS